MVARHSAADPVRSPNEGPGNDELPVVGEGGVRRAAHDQRRRWHLQTLLPRWGPGRRLGPGSVHFPDPWRCVMSTGRQYEFSQDENRLIGSLAGKMSVVGLFANLVGIINIVMALLVVAAIYSDKIPQTWKDKSKAYVEKLPEEYKKQAEELSVDKLPPKNHLWGIALNTGVVGVFYLMLGTWTRSSATSFKQIVDTQGQDISHLMKALDSLHSMYSLVYTLLMVLLIAGLVFLGLALFHRFGG